MQKLAYAITRKHGMKIGMGAYPLSEQASILATARRYTKAAKIQRTAMHNSKKREGIQPDRQFLRGARKPVQKTEPARQRHRLS
jgi:hypothetical protein